jgi:hypothetical protein
VTRVAADLGSGEAQLVADEVYEKNPRLHIRVDGAAIDGKRDVHANLRSWRGGSGPEALTGSGTTSVTLVGDAATTPVPSASGNVIRRYRPSLR